MLKFRFENLSNLPQGDHVLKMEKIEKFSSLGTFCLQKAFHIPIRLFYL